MRCGVNGVILGALAVLASGCATGPPTSGFLSDYSDFERVPADAPVWRSEAMSGVDLDALELQLWKSVNSSLSLADYDQVMIDPVAVKLRRDMQDAPIDPQRLAEFAEYLHDISVSAVEGAYPIVEEPAPRVLRFRAAITGVWPTYVFTQNQAVVSQVFNSFGGGASFESEALDALSGERVIAVIGQAQGDRWDAQNRREVYGQSKMALRGLARFIRQLMDDAHGGQAPLHQDVVQPSTTSGD